MLGFLKGKIDIELQTETIELGGNITGFVQLKLKESIRAKGLYIMLQARKNSKVRSRPGIGKRTTSARTEILYEESICLDGEKEYSPRPQQENYEFGIVMPTNLTQAPQKKVLKGLPNLRPEPAIKDLDWTLTVTICCCIIK